MFIVKQALSTTLLVVTAYTTWCNAQKLSSNGTSTGPFANSTVLSLSRKPTLTPSLALSNHTIATGIGESFASSCQTALWAWSSASSSYGSMHPFTTVTVFVATADSYTSTAITSFISASRLTTLCDGHPRAIGSAAFLNVSTIDFSAETQTITTIEDGTGYPAPTPCSINPSDCAALSSSYIARFLNTFDPLVNGTEVLQPPCATSGTANPLTAPSCTNPGIVGSNAQLLYWPVRTAYPHAGAFCDVGTGSLTVLAPQYITQPPTGAGPNTAVIDGVTITSPTVAISLSGLSRLDGCGTTLDKTIVPVNWNEVTSVIGDRADFGHLPFNYADLNWRCPSAGNSSSFVVEDAGGPDCYQDVPARAYFNAAPQYDLWNGVPPCSLVSTDPELAGFNCFESLTIVNDYRPIILPPETMLSAAQEIWGAYAFFFIDGVWDPPRALQPVSSVAGPTGFGGDGSLGATSVSAAAAQTTPAQPASPITPISPATTTSDSVAGPSTPVAEPDELGSTSAQDTLPAHDPTSAQGRSPGVAHTSAQNPASQGIPTTTQNVGNVVASVLGLKSTASAEDNSGLTPSDPSHASVQQNGNPGSDATTTATAAQAAPQQTVAIDNSIAFTASPVAGSNGPVVVAQGASSVTLTPGASAVSIGNQQVSAAHDGEIVVGTGNFATSITVLTNAAAAQTAGPGSNVAGPGNVVVTIGSDVVTASRATGGSHGNANLVLDGTTLAAGGPAVTLAHGNTLSLAPSGTAVVVNGQTSQIATAAAAQQQTAAAQITVAGSTIAANSASQFVVGSQTLVPGGHAITDLGTTYLLAPSGTALVVNGQTAAIAQPVSGASHQVEAIITAGTDTLTAYRDPSASGGVGVEGATLFIGGSALVIDGHTISLASTGIVEDGSKTIELASTSTQASAPAQGSITGPADSASTTASSGALKVKRDPLMWLYLLGGAYVVAVA